jgi:hypothetical protein
VGKEKEEFEKWARKLATAQAMEEIEEITKQMERARTLLELVERFGKV